MKGFDRLHIKDAVKARNKMDLQDDTLATMDIGQIVPLWSKELIAGDQFNVNPRFFSRMAPLVKPTYGKFYFKQMNVFVPFHQVAYDVDAWFDGKTTWEGVTPDTRGFTYGTYQSFLMDAKISSAASGSSDADFAYYSGSAQTLNYQKFTPFGKFVYKILTALGYTIPQGLNTYQQSTWYQAFISKRISALPLLCFAKAYNDYMSQSQRYNTSLLSTILREIKYNIQSTYYNTATHNLTPSGLIAIFESIKLTYENDYFTSAWQWPNSPLNTLESVGTSQVPSSGVNNLAPEIVNSNYYGTQLQFGVSPTYGTFLQRSLDWLQAFDNWVRRNNYAGSRVVQQIYSRFGIKPDDYKSHYADIISTHTMPVQVGDVTATTMATSQPLGDYAGKGIMSGGKGFSYHAADRGLLMVIGWYTVAPMMAYGFDRSVLKISPFDYYNPEFDGKAIQPISYGEVYTDPTLSVAGDTSLDNQVYGFTEIFNEYRFGRDRIIGDFRKYNNLDGMNTWHTGRLLSQVRAAGEMVAQSSSMVTLAQHSSEYDRIFSVTSGVDPFYLTCMFDVSAVRPILSLNQVPNLGEGSINVPRNGNEVN